MVKSAKETISNMNFTNYAMRTKFLIISCNMLNFNITNYSWDF